MARVLAQKVTGTCRMCASCSAVTKTGYLVRRGGAELFVCQSCFTVQPRPVARPRQVEPRPVRARPEIGRGRVLRELAALVNRGVEMLRVGVIAGLLLLVVMYGAKERPAIRPPYYVQYQMNKVERQAVRLQGRVLNIFTKDRG